ncbi:MAG: prepilin-type N-terminal cleavage/methylation domain-containing protein [Planctomycetota bacterium]
MHQTQLHRRRADAARASHVDTNPTLAQFGKNAGVSMVELMVVLTILTVAMGMYASTVISTAKLRAIHRETSIAAEAARATIERMHNVPFAEIFARYNANGEDDPEGADTAPGAFFTVQGLDALPGSEGFVGEVILPTGTARIEVPVEIDPATQRLIDLGRISPPRPVFKNELQLREDVQDERLGLPRDLNGDNVVDDADHSDGYVILPVRVRLSWQGRQGNRTYELSTMLTEFRRAY